MLPKAVKTAENNFYAQMQGRSHLNHEKQEFAHEHPHLKTLEEVVNTIKPTAIIGEFTAAEHMQWINPGHVCSILNTKIHFFLTFYCLFYPFTLNLDQV